MAWVTPTIAAIGAAASLGSAALNASRNNNQQIQQSYLANQGGQQAAAALQQADLIQALINQRSTAGYVDQAGTSLRYDPATNQWISALGPIPQQAQTAADMAAIRKNTTEQRMQELLNEQAALRAARYEPYADTTRRQLESFRPMGQDELTGLLTRQATTANDYTYRPLVADTLRAFARTGTSAGPVLAQLGRTEAQGLRDSLLDAQIKGMTNVDSINQGRRQALESAAATGQSLATPALGSTSVDPSSYASTMANLVANRSSTASTAPAYGAGAVNTAAKNVVDALSGAQKAVPNTNFGLQQGINSLDQLSTSMKPGGDINTLANAVKSWSDSGTSSNLASTLNQTSGSYDALAAALQLPANSGQYLP